MGRSGFWILLYPLQSRLPWAAKEVVAARVGVAWLFSMNGTASATASASTAKTGRRNLYLVVPFIQDSPQKQLIEKQRDTPGIEPEEKDPAPSNRSAKPGSKQGRQRSSMLIVSLK